MQRFVAFAVVLVVLNVSTATLAQAPSSTALDIMAGNINLDRVTRVDVFRINPWLAGVIAVRPSHVNESYADRATVTYLDRAGVLAIIGALKSSQVLDEKCAMGTYTYNTFPVAWTVTIFDKDNAELGSIDLTENGLCAATPRHVFSIDTSLVIFLRRHFGFMNY